MTTGWRAALLEIEHQAEHWDTPDHGQTGHLIAQALRAAADIARTGGLRCQHRAGQPGLLQSILGPGQPGEAAPPLPQPSQGSGRPPWAW